MVYRFADYRVDVAARRLERCNEPVPLQARPFELLVYLIRERGRVVPREELQTQIWRNAAGSYAALARAMTKLRQAFAASGGAERFIQTVQRVGWRFVAALSEDAHASSSGRGLTVALLPVENATGDPSLSWLELGLMALAARHLEQHPVVAPAAVPSVMTALQGARAAGERSMDAAVIRATGVRTVVHSRVVRGREGELRLLYASRGDVRFKGRVAAERATDLAARLAEVIAQALHPCGAPASAAARHDPLADEAFARGLQALAVQRWSRAVHLLRLALELEPDRTDVQLELFRALGNLGDCSVLPLAHRLLAKAEQESDDWTAARVHQAVGRLHLNRSELAQADHHLSLALQHANGKGSPDWTARTLMLQAGAAASRLEYARTRQIVGRMYEQCERSGDRILPIAGLNFEAQATAMDGDLHQAVALSLEAARRAREVRATHYLFCACDNAAGFLAKLGRLAEAAAQAEDAVAASLSGDHVRDAWYAMPMLCWIYRLACMPQAARRAIESMPGSGGNAPDEHVWRARGLLAAAEGRHAEAAEDLFRAVRLQRERGHGFDEEQSLPWLIDALIASGRLDEAQAELQATTAAHLSGSRDLKAQAVHARAALAHARGRTDEALGGLVQLADSDAAPLWRARACIDLAWLQAEGGRSDLALQTLARVPHALADHPTVREVRARVRMPAAPPAAAIPCLPTRR